ncbi:uncharacterized protein V6R79_009149 [Siganus canaliculatus]
MAAAGSNKPFSPEEVQEILQHLHQPAVFTNMTSDWPVLRWTAEHLSSCLGDKLVRFRLGRKEETKTPLFETQCSYLEARLAHFLSWTQGQTGTHVGPFSEYPRSDYWAYADYKYIAMLFQDQPSIFEEVRWSQFGFEGRNGRESTLWIGTEGANTPCHLDSYGYNLVLQIQGRKRWHLFPPQDTVNLYPTRIPYEESSVFSQVDVLHPDLKKFPAFQRARAHVVTLQPGQVLFVPRHWWHYVESVDPVTVSVNSWIELEVDDMARVGEAVTKAVVCALKSAPSDDNTDDWLNPTEGEVASHNENMQYVNLAVRASAQRQRGLSHSRHSLESRVNRPVKRDSRGQIMKDRDLTRCSVAFTVPFGPSLTPVASQQDHLAESKEVTAKDLEVNPQTAPGDRLVFAARLHQETHECSPHTWCRPRPRTDGISENSTEDYEEPVHPMITTNDLINCLVHPDIIASVTKLLLERHTDQHRTSTPL